MYVSLVSIMLRHSPAGLELVPNWQRQTSAVCVDSTQRYVCPSHLSQGALCTQTSIPLQEKICKQHISYCAKRPIPLLTRISCWHQQAVLSMTSWASEPTKAEISNMSETGCLWWGSGVQIMASVCCDGDSLASVLIAENVWRKHVQIYETRCQDSILYRISNY